MSILIGVVIVLLNSFTCLGFYRWAREEPLNNDYGGDEYGVESIFDKYIYFINGALATFCIMSVLLNVYLCTKSNQRQKYGSIQQFTDTDTDGNPLNQN